MSLPEVVGVYGGGRMGAGIAHAFLASGSTVVVVENDDAAAEAARDRVTTSLQRAEERGKLSGALGAHLERFSVTTSASDLADAGLVVEAVPEDTALKQRILAAVEAAAPEAVLASNTSSLSIGALASGLTAPDRFLGLHFFNPVPASDLVEIVVGPKTDAALVTAAQGWVAALGKTAITVTDSPGFASSRLGVAIALEAMRMLEEGVASAEDIDTAMTLGYRHPVGPLRTTDLVGLDVRLAIAEHLARELGPRFEPPRLLRDLVAAGKLGRKSGEGFYTW
ncbi:3-hydroxyacyl-CoA dehydrogenase family protein [Nocardioides panaciterrulae]|uniref:3-hydroxybutyryl-CoA dehydrogenase n=1 Tax=Nocardioides panaciterrulae TaxID=661492 RepID=A0A7Y9JCA7_9ACTN|nr:3-hydroxyacyl-CoA dehydrogenase family protein [Nocardioides panaciterrulae]NYD43795.1 3-hydroxybutyryl-CoA dehydrogenase [Nocardioides panaciterrulae]